MRAGPEGSSPGPSPKCHSSLHRMDRLLVLHPGFGEGVSCPIPSPAPPRGQNAKDPCHGDFPVPSGDSRNALYPWKCEVRFEICSRAVWRPRTRSLLISFCWPCCLWARGCVRPAPSDPAAAHLPTGPQCRRDPWHCPWASWWAGHSKWHAVPSLLLDIQFALQNRV